MHLPIGRRNGTGRGVWSETLLIAGPCRQHNISRPKVAVPLKLNRVREIHARVRAALARESIKPRHSTRSYWLLVNRKTERCAAHRVPLRTVAARPNSI